MLGCEALLQPVVQMDAPGSAAFPQLVEPAEAPQSDPYSKRLALLVKLYLPVVLASVNERVGCRKTSVMITDTLMLQYESAELKYLCSLTGVVLQSFSKVS